MRRMKRGRHYAKTGKKRKIAVVLSVVALVEVLAIMLVSTSAWIESISSIKIYTKDGAKGIVESANYQQVNLSNSNGTEIDLSDYFRPSGGYHLAPASSSDGDTMYFKAGMNGSTQLYRVGSVSDKNVNYVSFTVKTLSNVSLSFAQAPTIKFDGTALSGANRKLVRFSVGDTNGNFTVYSLYDQEFTENVISGENGTSTASVTVHPFSEYIAGKKRVVETTANGYLSFNMWIQDPTGASSSVYHNKALSVENFKLVTVIPFTVKAVTNNALGGAGGSVAIENSSYAASVTYYTSLNRTLSLHAAPSTTNGYQFIGWADSETGSVIANSDVDPFSYTVRTANKTLYAKFSNQHELYMKPSYQHSSNNSNVRFAAYVFGIDNSGQNTHTWYNMTAVTSGTWDGYYKCSYTGSATNVIFCYMDGSSVTNDWSNRWLQTFDLRVPSKNGEYGYIVTCRAVVGTARNQTITNYGTNKLFGYWRHSHAQVVASTFKSGSGTAGTVSVAITDSSCVNGTANWYPYPNDSTVNLDGQTYQDEDDNGDLIDNQSYNKMVTLTAADSSTMDFKGWYSSPSSTTALSVNKTYEVAAPDNPTYTSGTTENTNSITYYAKYEPKPEQWFLKGSFNSWGEGNAFTQSSGNTYTAQIHLDEGNYTFKIYDDKRSTWYSNSGNYYVHPTNPSLPSSTTISGDSGNIALWATKGTYTFTWDISSHQLSISVSYDTVRIWFDTSMDSSNINNDAKIYFAATGYDKTAMTKSGNNWYIDVQSKYHKGIWFNRCKSDDANTTWNSWNAGDRDVGEYTYKPTAWGQADGSGGSGDWQ